MINAIKTNLKEEGFFGGSQLQRLQSIKGWFYVFVPVTSQKYHGKWQDIPLEVSLKHLI